MLFNFDMKQIGRNGESIKDNQKSNLLIAKNIYQIVK